MLELVGVPRLDTGLWSKTNAGLIFFFFLSFCVLLHMLRSAESSAELKCLDVASPLIDYPIYT